MTPFTVRVALTEEDRTACYRLRAAEYGKFYDNIPADEFRDEYDDAVLPRGRPFSDLLLVEIDGSPVATARVAFGRDVRQPSVLGEASELMRFDWADVSNICDANADVAVELGKLAVRRGSDTRRVLTEICRKTGQLAAGRGAGIVVAIASSLVQRSFREAGYEFLRAPGATLRRECPNRLRYFVRYHDYFLPTLRKRGLEIDPSLLDSSSAETLDMLLANVDDGPKLWCIQVAKLIGDR